MQKRQFSINSTGRTLYGDYRIPDFPENKPLVIFCHGFKGFKDWGGWQFAMDKICQNGFFVIAMNFSQNGIGPDLQNFTALDKFSVNTIGKEMDDIALLLESIELGEEFPELAPGSRKGLIGHSRGGGTSILFSAFREGIDALVSWASVSNFDNYINQKDDWRARGYIEQENKRTGQMMRMNIDFLNDLEANPLERNILVAESRLEIPHLIIHGDQDDAVSLEHAEALYNSADKTKTKIEILNGASHTFGTAHPFEGSNPHFDKLIELTINWFRNFLVQS